MITRVRIFNQAGVYGSPPVLVNREAVALVRPTHGKDKGGEAVIEFLSGRVTKVMQTYEEVIYELYGLEQP
jgi:hypothetical protein